MSRVCPAARSCLAAALCLLGVTACGPSAEAVAQAQERARLTSLELQAQLLAELEAALAWGDEAAAAEAFAGVAQPLTARMGAGVGVSLRRVALQPRNPLDRPDELERAWLLDLRARPGDPPPAPRHAVVRAPGGGHELRYLDPIVAQPACLSCHAPPDQLAPDVAAVLRRLYPLDESPGFRAGTVVGAVSVRVPLD